MDKFVVFCSICLPPGERLLADAFCMNHFFLRQGISAAKDKPIDLRSEFKRQQSELYNKLHPSPVIALNKS